MRLNKGVSTIRCLVLAGLLAGAGSDVQAGTVPKDARLESLAHAKIWQEPDVPVSLASLGPVPGPAGVVQGEVSCKFRPRPIRSGNMPKFECIFENGEILKVKYDNREVHTDSAASRLLSALGFGADQGHVVKRVRCYGCPKDPFQLLQCISNRPSGDCLRSVGATRDASGGLKLDYRQYVDFGPVSIERYKPGALIESRPDQGWSWKELDQLADPQAGGATRAERDALRLMVVFLNNWDTKSANQTLICLPDSGGPQECSRPFAYMGDVGATFGGSRSKLDVESWSRLPIWADARSCRVAFGPAKISEEGRQLLARLLTQLSASQVNDLFEGHGFLTYAKSKANSEGGKWLAAFQTKVRQIAERPPCPS